MAVITFLSCGCEDKTSPSEFRIDIRVIDENNNPVQGADVGFYYDEISFNANQSPVDHVITNQNGVASFLLLEEAFLRLSSYYVSATKGEANNWYDKISFKIKDSLSVNESFVQIKETLEGKLGGRAGKRWQQVAYIVNGRDFDDCRFRYVSLFKRQRIYPESALNFRKYFEKQESNYKTCTKPNRLAEVGYWTLNRKRDAISFRDYEKKIVDLTETEMTLQYNPTEDLKIIERYKLVK